MPEATTPTTPKLDIKLLGFEYSEKLSDDSNAWAAELVINGKKRGQVRDDGQGGSLRFDDWQAAREINDYAKTLPKHKFDYGDGQTMELDMNADLLLGTMAEQRINDRYQQQAARRRKAGQKRAAR